MYGGLFGDLPAAKNDPQKNDSTTPLESKDVSQAATSESSSKHLPSNPPLVVPPVASVPSAPSKVSVVRMVPRSSKMIPTHALRPRQPPPRKTPIVADPVQAPLIQVPPEHQPIKEETITADTGRNDTSTETSMPSTTHSIAAAPLPVTDPYDPMVPNDVLAYWDRQAAAKQQERWAQERAQLLRDQEAVRRRLEQERQSLLQQGNVEALVERGRGRGGLSNVPAWLVAQQKQQQQGKAP